MDNEAEDEAYDNEEARDEYSEDDEEQQDKESDEAEDDEPSEDNLTTNTDAQGSYSHYRSPLFLSFSVYRK